MVFLLLSPVLPRRVQSILSTRGHPQGHSRRLDTKDHFTAPILEGRVLFGIRTPDARRAFWTGMVRRVGVVVAAAAAETARPCVGCAEMDKTPEAGIFPQAPGGRLGCGCSERRFGLSRNRPVLASTGCDGWDGPTGGYLDVEREEEEESNRRGSREELQDHGPETRGG